VREPRRRHFQGGRGRGRLEFRARDGRGADRPARRPVVAHYRGVVHPAPRQAGKAGRRPRGPQVLRLVVQERPEDGRRARLRADARRGGEADPGERLEGRDRRQRQARALSMTALLDNAGMARGGTRAAATNLPRPSMLRNNALMDALFRNLTRFFALLVFSLLAAILVSLLYGSSLSLAKF